MAPEEKKYKRKKKTVGSYQYGSVIFGITLALFVMGLLGLVVIITERLTNTVRANFEVTVFLNKNISENQRNRIESELAGSAYLLQKEGQPQLRFKSKEEAIQEFTAEVGEDFSNFLGKNPLRDALIINIAPNFQDSTQLDSIADRIENISGVYETSYSSGVLESIERNKVRIGLILSGLAVILLLVSILLIHNTIKLALFSQRFLIRSMQLVGATGSFIRRPFLNRSFLHGAISGGIASGMLLGLLQLGSHYIDQLEEMQEQVHTLLLCGSLVLLGSFIALISTNQAMNKYLKMSLDELY